MKNNYFPSNSMLEETVIKSLELLNGIATTKQINQK